MIDTSKELRPDILTEQAIPDHVFVYIARGTIHCYDGDRRYTFRPGQYCLARKNRLARYMVDKGPAGFEPIIVCLEERFLKEFQQKHRPEVRDFNPEDTFIKINKNKLIPGFIRSLKPYYDRVEKIDEAFEYVKNEELLIILLQSQPELAGLLFNYGPPGKVALEAFMNRNYKFNVSLQRFAYLTGRSLSAFKRDFKTIFNEPPSRWLVRKRLEEAYFLIGQRNEKPSGIYLELGFEDLSHFSFAFKKQFGLRPTELVQRTKQATDSY